MPTADPPLVDPYESLDTEQRQRSVALKVARDALRSSSVFAAASPLPADSVIQVAEYIVSGRTDGFPPLVPDLIIPGGDDDSLYDEPTYTDDQLREAGPTDA